MNFYLFFKVAIIVKIFSICFLRKLTEIQPNVFFKYKKIAKIILKNFFEYFFRKFFFYEHFFRFFLRQICLRKFFFTNFFFVKIFIIEFFWRKFFFHKNISAKIFFTVFSRISFVFDVCEIVYFAQFFIPNFAHCEFFCFAILVYGKKIVNFFCDFFFSDKREYQI